MTPAQIAVTLSGVLLAIAVNVYFFAPAGSRRARGAGAGPRQDAGEDRER
jgi:hypothetical protein